MLLQRRLWLPGRNNSQVWYLYNTTANDKWGNSELYMSTTGAPSGSVGIPAGTNKMWIADKIALADVTFPNDMWAIRFATDQDWGASDNGGNFRTEIGYWGLNPAYPSGPQYIFTVLAMDSSGVWADGYYECEFKGVPDAGQTIPVGTYLAVVVYNNGGVGHPIYTGYQINPPKGSYYYSCITSPQSDPGYPLPELATGILLGAGILGLGGFMIIRHRKLAVKA